MNLLEKKWASDHELINALLNKIEKKSQTEVKSLKVGNE